MEGGYCEMKNSLNSHEVARWFIYHNPMLANACFDSNAKLNKLLYLSSLLYYSVNKDKLLDEAFVAFRYGPVIPSIYRDYRYHGLCNYPSDDYIRELTVDKKQALQIVNFVYGDMSAEALIDLTHTHNIWLEKADELSNKPEIVFSNASKELLDEFIFIYNLYHDYDFDNLKKDIIDGNIFYYSKDIDLTDKDIEYFSTIEKQDQKIFVELIDGEWVFS